MTEKKPDQEIDLTLEASVQESTAEISEAPEQPTSVEVLPTEAELVLAQELQDQTEAVDHLSLEIKQMLATDSADEALDPTAEQMMNAVATETDRPDPEEGASEEKRQENLPRTPADIFENFAASIEPHDPGSKTARRYREIASGLRGDGEGKLRAMEDAILSVEEWLGNRFVSEEKHKDHERLFQELQSDYEKITGIPYDPGPGEQLGIMLGGMFRDLLRPKAVRGESARVATGEVSNRPKLRTAADAFTAVNQEGSPGLRTAAEVISTTHKENEVVDSLPQESSEPYQEFGGTAHIIENVIGALKEYSRGDEVPGDSVQYRIEKLVKKLEKSGNHEEAEVYRRLTKKLRDVILRRAHRRVGGDDVVRIEDALDELEKKKDRWAN